jgi:DNA-binding beta-propeller fold protein YncE
VSKIAGIGSGGSSLAELLNPSGLAVDSNGTYLYVADRGNDRILRWSFINPTINGTLIASITDNLSITNATLDTPQGIILNQQGTALFID